MKGKKRRYLPLLALERGVPIASVICDLPTTRIYSSSTCTMPPAAEFAFLAVSSIEIARLEVVVRQHVVTTLDHC